MDHCLANTPKYFYKLSKAILQYIQEVLTGSHLLDLMTYVRLKIHHIREGNNTCEEISLFLRIPSVLINSNIFFKMI